MTHRAERKSLRRRRKNYDHLDAIVYRDLRSSTARASESALSPGPTSLAPCQVSDVAGAAGVVIAVAACRFFCICIRLLPPFLDLLCCSPSGAIAEPSSWIRWPNGIPGVGDAAVTAGE